MKIHIKFRSFYSTKFLEILPRIMIDIDGGVIFIAWMFWGVDLWGFR